MFTTRLLLIPYSLSTLQLSRNHHGSDHSFDYSAHFHHHPLRHRLETMSQQHHQTLFNPLALASILRGLKNCSSRRWKAQWREAKGDSLCDVIDRRRGAIIAARLSQAASQRSEDDNDDIWSWLSGKRGFLTPELLILIFFHFPVLEVLFFSILFSLIHLHLNFTPVLVAPQDHKDCCFNL